MIEFQNQSLAPMSMKSLDFSQFVLGQPQQTANLTVVPIFGGKDFPEVAPPRTGLKLKQVITYGSIELSNSNDSGVAIVPLHIGYVQHGAQNHALCQSAFIAPGQTLPITDACCVQAAQGGYLTESDQWFFVLPYELREAALELRGHDSYNKLWDAITQLNQSINLPARGHLEQILTRKRAFLTQYQTRLELLPNQRGALFFLNDRLLGIEIAPNEDYFRELWMALVCFCYGVASWADETVNLDADIMPSVEPFAATSLMELQQALTSHRHDVQERIASWIDRVPTGNVKVKEEDRYLDFELSTVTSDYLAGQFVKDRNDGQVAYASLFARKSA